MTSGLGSWRRRRADRRREKSTIHRKTEEKVIAIDV